MLYKCRACLESSKNMKFLTEDESEGKQLISMYTSITNFKWTKNENVALYLCSECEATLEMSYKFQKMCFESYEVIREFKNTKTDGLNESEKIVAEDFIEEIIIERDSEQSDDDKVIIKKEANDLNKTIECNFVCEQTEEEYEQEITKNEQEFPSEKVENVIAMYKLKQEKNSYKCLVCPYILATSRAISAHMAQSHNEVWQKWCIHCNEIVDNIKEHQNIHKSLTEVCPFCKKEVKKIYYIAHLKMHSDVKPYRCLLCPSGFLSNCTLKAHFSSVHPEEFEEDEEDADDSDDPLKFVKIKNENSVKRTHGNYCGKCDKRVKNLSTHVLIVHQKNEEESDKYKCHLCAKEMKSAASLKGHLKVHEGDTPFKCLHCGKLHKNNSQLIEHVRIHTGEKPYVCNVCGRGFAQAGALGTHMRLHTGRPEVCPICGKRFCRPSVLKIHLQRHAGEKPFLCTECGRTFLQKSHLMGHMKTHSDARPYKCPHCDKAFKQKSLLNSHIQIHSGYKPYECQYCDYAAFKQYRLQQHMKLHCGDSEKKEIYICPICQNGFTSRSVLNSHVKASHNAII